MMRTALTALTTILGLALAAVAQDAPPARVQDQAACHTAKELTARGAKYLLSAQASDGGWAAELGPGVSALVVKALAQEPTVGPSHAAVRRGVEFVLRSKRPNGGIYSAEGTIKNYETSTALSMLSVLNDRQYDPVISAAQKFLIENQWDENEGRSIDDPWYGGAGYGHGQRPDLSNTQMMLEALRDSGLPPDHPAYRKALVFISRCQMNGESNDQPYAAGSNTGGFIYSPANGGESKGGNVEVNGREELRCYGSMSYAGFKSMLYAGLSKDDPRVRAALDWISKNWTLDHNPNMPERQSKEGLFYFYHVFGRALDAAGLEEINDATGRAHNWRAELVAKLRSLQKDDGSWVNDADRWYEGHPALVTAYSMLALEAACGGASSE